MDLKSEHPEHFDSISQEIEYWQSRTVSERISRVEELRKRFWGEAYTANPHLDRNFVRKGRLGELE